MLGTGNFPDFFGKIWFLGNGIWERRPLPCGHVVLAISRVEKYDHIILNGKVISSTNYTMNVIKSSLVGVLSTKFAFQL